jgi:hypothetical protein
MTKISEEARLAALGRLKLLDTPPSEAFDRVTRMASRLFGLPIAAVSLTDMDRQWFKSKVGIEHSAMPRRGLPARRWPRPWTSSSFPIWRPIPPIATARSGRAA